MSYCFNLNCHQPQNQGDSNVCANCSSNLLLSDAAKSGGRSHRYRAIRVIGRGGFGKTYLAKNETDNSSCVIKQFTFPGSSSTALRLFSEEAQQLKALGSHPQIPSFVDYIEQENQCFIIQEFVDGSNLEEELTDNGAFSENQIQELLLSILPVIEFVHSHNVIHRDIKPENIIRHHSDRSFSIVDFGAAKRATETALAKTGTTIGSAGYAAPEQTFGKAVVGSDLYSLGVTCIHLLTGMHPFDLIDSAEGNWVWRDYLKQPVSKKLGQILDKLLKRGTRQRYQSATAVMEDMRSQTEDFTVAAKELSREVAELIKQTSVERSPVRRLQKWKVAAISLVVVGGLGAIPIVISIVNQPQVATVPQRQVHKAPPTPLGLPTQLPKEQPNNSQEESPEVASGLTRTITIICQAISTTVLILGIASIGNSVTRGESPQSGISLIGIALILSVISKTVLPSMVSELESRNSASTSISNEQVQHRK